MRILLPGLLCLLLNSLFAQSGQILFPGVSGQALLDSLKLHYKTDSVLSYAMARDTLYAKVLAIDDDTLRCIYSDHALYLDPTQDPTQYVYLSGTSNGMNTEHAYPQGKGAIGNARSDMHLLFPAKIPVNEARGDFPYAEIPDAQTQKWFYKTVTLTSIPPSQIDRYAESRSGAFEPREAAKGDVARAVFYFYTMYKNQADSIDPNFFELQRATLCQWHRQDPADQKELIKTWRIAPYQQQIPNPFIVDCSLAARCYCPGEPVNCLVSIDLPTQHPAIFQAFPSPFRESITLSGHLPFGGKITGVLRDVNGREYLRFEENGVLAGPFQKECGGSEQVPPGACWLDIQLTGTDGQTVRQTISLIRIKRS